jgi:hypothetical protein
MSTAAVSSSSLASQIQQYFQTRQSDLQQLGTDLSRGDLAGAQSEFAAITTLGQSGPFSSGNAFANSTRESDFNAIGTALQAGDLQGAQTAFAQLKSTFRNSGGYGGQPVPVSPVIADTGTADAAATAANSVGPEIILNLGNTSTPEQITINIGAESSTGQEQVLLSVASPGSSPQNFSLNLNANSNEQVVLNLAAATSSTSSTATTGSTLNVTA